MWLKRLLFYGERDKWSWRRLPQDAQKVRSARPQPMKAPEALPLGYVEDGFEARTMLAGFFSILPRRSSATG
jgi:hypothetical protein